VNACNTDNVRNDCCLALFSSSGVLCRMNNEYKVSGKDNIGSDRRPETKQGIEGKIVRFRSGRVRDMVRVRDKDR